jgi:hypothetical protein
MCACACVCVLNVYGRGNFIHKNNLLRYFYSGVAEDPCPLECHAASKSIVTYGSKDRSASIFRAR